MTRIFAAFETRGDSAYFGEAVSQTEHALQAAALAADDNAPNSLIVAALLHDFGHLAHDETLADSGIDGRHEDDGARFLSAYFGPEITEPIRLHVDAKRYLCATDPTYFAALSPASVASLALQGGPFSERDIAAFEENPFFADAIRLRRYDDIAKEVGKVVPPLEHYAPLLKIP